MSILHNCQQLAVVSHASKSWYSGGGYQICFLRIFHLNESKQRTQPAADLTEDAMNKGFERGLLMLSCGKSVIRIAPPLCITKSEMDEGLKIFEESLVAAEKEAK